MDRLRYEIRIMGLSAGATPLLIISALLVLIGLLRLFTAHGTPATMTDLLTAGIEMLLPLAGGVIVAAVLTQDTALELQLTLPAPYRQTVFRRTAIIVGWTGLITLLVATVIFALHLWRVPAQIMTWQGGMLYLGEQLIWLSPLLWFAGIGTCLALWLQSSALSGAILSVIWLLEAFTQLFFTIPWLHPFWLFPTTFAPEIDFWLVNRCALLGMAILFFALGWWLLRRPESLVRIGSHQS